MPMFLERFVISLARFITSLARFVTAWAQFVTSQNEVTNRAIFSFMIRYLIFSRYRVSEVTNRSNEVRNRVRISTVYNTTAQLLLWTVKIWIVVQLHIEYSLRSARKLQAAHCKFSHRGLREIFEDNLEAASSI